MTISVKHRAFIDEYLITSNATEAYDRVYHPKSRAIAASAGYRLLRNVEILEAIQQRLSETAMMADEVLMRLAAQARGNMNDFVRFSSDGDPIFDLQSAATFGKLGLVKKLKVKTRSYATVEVAPQQDRDESAEIEDGDAPNTRDDIDISGVIETTIEFELYSSQAALELIGKHHGLFDKRGSEEDPVHNVDWTVEQWREERAKRQEQAAKTTEMFDDGDDGELGDE